MDKFKEEYGVWLEKHKLARSGERLRRLKKVTGMRRKNCLSKCFGLCSARWTICTRSMR